MIINDALVEEDLQRRELQRLLSTARDEDRKAMIRKAISALDMGTEMEVGSQEHATKEKEHKIFNTLHPSIHSSIFESESIPVIEQAPGHNPLFGKRRPSSASRRRPSTPNLLDVIPERVVTLKNTHFHTRRRSNSLNEEDRPTSSGSVTSISSGDQGDSADIYLEDVQDVVASSGDSRYPLKTLFVANSLAPTGGRRSSKSWERHSWTSTGLLPQFLRIQFVEKWIITKIEVRCIGISALTVHVHPSALSSLQSTKELPMDRTSETHFSLDLAAVQQKGKIFQLGHNSSSHPSRRKENLDEREKSLGFTGCALTLFVPDMRGQRAISASQAQSQGTIEINSPKNKAAAAAPFVTIHEIKIKVLPHT